MLALVVVALTSSLPPGIIAGRAASQIASVPICAIQGTGSSSPLRGQVVTTEGVVTADLAATEWRGLFLEHPECDGDGQTSDGIFVYLGNVAVQATVGDWVQVTGTVTEYYGLTEIKIDRRPDVLRLRSAPLPAGATVEDVVTAEAFHAQLEPLEGMRVALPPMRVVAATNDAGTAFLVPAASGIERVFRGPDELWLVGLDMPIGRLLLSHGDEIHHLVGPLGFAFERYRLVMPSSATGDWASIELRPGGRVPEAVEGDANWLTLASYNLHDLFDTQDDPATADAVLSRFAYAEALAGRAHTIAAHLDLPDILAVQEVENLAALRELATQPELGDADYEAVLIEGPDGRGIDVGLLFKRRHLRLRAPPEARQACSRLALDEPGVPCRLPDGSPGSALFGRPPLVVRLAEQPSGRWLTVVVNHFKSQRGDDRLVERVHAEMASHLVALVAELRASEPDAPVFVVGDLNSPSDSPVLATLRREAGLIDLHQTVLPEQDYTYAHNGVSQVLDYILTDRDVGVITFRPVHCNVDFPVGAPPTFASGSQPARLRDSDHDPVWAALERQLFEAWRLYVPFVACPVERSPAPEPTPSRRPTRNGTPTRPSTPTAVATARPSGTAPTVTRAPESPRRWPLRIEELFYNGRVPIYESDEYLAFRNVSDQPVVLTGWQIISVRGNQRFTFPTAFRMEAGTSCRLYTNEIRPEHCGLSWRSEQPIWRNSGDKAELRDQAGTLVDWYCYGDMSRECP